MLNSQLINQDSGNFEYYSPKFIVEAARKVMGSIDLDPASSEKANKIVKATYFYNQHHHSLSQKWMGKVFLNHPFSRENNRMWIRKITSQYINGWIEQACCITFAATSEKWFQPLLDYPICFLSPRTNYYSPDGTKKKGVTKGSCVTYMGDNEQKFKKIFSEFGKVMKLL